MNIHFNIPKYIFLLYIITEIDECASNPCQNGGTCTDMLNDYSCSCSPGYSDKNCQTGILRYHKHFSNLEKRENYT